MKKSIILILITIIIFVGINSCSKEKNEPDITTNPGNLETTGNKSAATNEMTYSDFESATRDLTTSITQNGSLASDKPDLSQSCIKSSVPQTQGKKTDPKTNTKPSISNLITTSIITNPPIIPPAKYKSVGVKSIDEIKDFVNNNDSDTFYEGQYKTMIENVRNRGYIIEPLYNNKSILFFPRSETPIALRFETQYEGVGYAYFFETELASGNFIIYYLKQDDVKYAQNDIYPFLLGKRGKSTSESAIKGGWITKKTSFGEKILDSCYLSYENDKNATKRDHLLFMYNDYYIIKINIFESSSINAIEFAKNISLKEISLK